MADRLGVPEASYLLWERGRKSPSLRALPPLLAALGQPPTAPAADAPLGTRLRAWRLADGLSQAEAACRAGLDPKTLGTAELGRPVSRASAAALETMRRRAGAADRA